MSSTRLNAYKLFLTILFGITYQNSYAACQCRCVNGSVQALCSSTLDVQPICAPQVCPIVPPAVQPIATPQVPPLGTSSCNMQQVYNSQKGLYEWKNICR
jgi:hypothetical protein